MKTVTPEQAKAALIAKVAKESGHLAYLVRLNAWTLISEYAEQISKDALGIRALEAVSEQQDAEQEEFSALTSSPRQASLNFSASVLHTSSRRELPASPSLAAGSVVFGGLR